MSSYIAKPSEIERKWYVLDAEGKTLGHLASEAASILRGKKKPTYTPFLDCGDYVIVINAEKIEVTGKKAKEKIYKHHTGYPGGLKEITFEKLQAKDQGTPRPSDVQEAEGLRRPRAQARSSEA